MPLLGQGIINNTMQKYLTTINEIFGNLEKDKTKTIIHTFTLTETITETEIGLETRNNNKSLF